MLQFVRGPDGGRGQGPRQVYEAEGRGFADVAFAGTADTSGTVGLHGGYIRIHIRNAGIHVMFTDTMQPMSRHE